jgi:hypothetical protein
MDVAEVRVVEGKKFMWDGEDYPDRGSAEARRDEYRAKGFEVDLVQAGERWLVYTRRVVREIPPPPG